jgi:hypothetical protein
MNTDYIKSEIDKHKAGIEAAEKVELSAKAIKKYHEDNLKNAENALKELEKEVKTPKPSRFLERMAEEMERKKDEQTSAERGDRTS